MQAALDAGASAARRATIRWSSTARRSTRRAASTSLNPSHKRAGRRHASAMADAEHAEQAVAAAARGASRPGRQLGAERRAEYLRRAADVMRRAALRAGRLGSLRVRQAVARGRRRRRRGDRLLRVLRRRRDRAGRSRSGVDVPGEENRFVYEPRGVAVVIAPWNFPLAILTGMTTAALVTGNTVVMKPAEQSPVIAAKLMEIFAGGRLAAGRGQLPARRRRGGRRRRWSSIRDVALIAFTGSRGGRPGDQPPGGRGLGRGQHARQARHRRDGRQERDHRRRRRRPGRSGAGRRARARSATRARSARPARGRSCSTASTTRSSSGWSRRRAA